MPSAIDPVPGPATHGLPDRECGSVPLGQVLENLSDELSVACGICVNVEEIIADRLLAGAPASEFLRVELQNVDRLIQMLGDFRALVAHLSRTVEGSAVDRDAASRDMVMDELIRRLLAAEPTRRPGQEPPSDVTFF